MKRVVMTGFMSGLMLTGIAGSTIAQEVKASWTDSVKVSGDTRLRLQYNEEESKVDRARWRFRGRVGLSGQVNDEVKAEIRFVTNVGDPTSDNITMGGIGDPFEDPSAAMDRANFTWTPVDVLALKFGKMGQPWTVVDDLVMTSDANPEGIAANATFGMDAVALMLHGGVFVLQERKADDDTMLYTGQVAAKFGDKQYVMVGGTVYSYSSMKGFAPLGDNNNTTVTVGEDKLVANEFTVVEGFVEAGFDIAKLPVKVGAQYIVNTEADSNDSGYLGSASVKLPAGFSAGYQYRYVEKDATFSGLAESTDFSNGGVDIKGHIPYVKYQISKNFDVKAQYAMGQKGLDNGKDLNTFKIDLACKF